VSGKAKTKLAAAVELATVEAVDAALVQIAQCDAEVARLEAEIAESERIAREQRADLLQTFLERAAMGREAVEASAEAHEEWFAEARSLDLPHGRIGWRKVTSIKLPKAVERVIAALRQPKLFDAVAVRETVRKEILETYEDATLEAVGAKRVTKDDFYIALGEKTGD
jgi:phage host-nuclease inhibitor protein Gam